MSAHVHICSSPQDLNSEPLRVSEITVKYLSIPELDYLFPVEYRNRIIEAGTSGVRHLPVFSVTF